MAQRGGAVQATLRIADRPIHSDLVPHGEADLVVALEPLESLRYLEYLAPKGVLLTSQEPIRNFPNYPDLERVFARIRSLPRAVLVDTKTLARQAGSPLTSNVVMVGAASAFLPLEPETLEAWIRKIFGGKGDRIVQANLKAFQSGREAVPCEVA